MAFCSQLLVVGSHDRLTGAESEQSESMVRSHPEKPYSTRCHSDIIGKAGLRGSRRRRDVTEPWMSADDIATHLGVTKDTVYTWIAEKGMPAHKIGRLWKFQASEVDDWVRGGGAVGNVRDGAEG